MEFIVPEVRLGPQVTVRLSENWNGKRGPVALFDAASGIAFGLAEITETQTCKFLELNEDVLELYHDSSVDSWATLAASLDAMYDDFLPNSVVTVVYFEVVDVFNE